MKIVYKQVADDHLIIMAFPTGAPCIGAGKTLPDALSEAVSTLSDAIGEVCKIAPVPELKGLHPVVIYFATKEDAYECCEIIQARNLRLKAHQF